MWFVLNVRQTVGIRSPVLSALHLSRADHTRTARGTEARNSTANTRKLCYVRATEFTGKNFEISPMVSCIIWTIKFIRRN